MKIIDTIKGDLSGDITLSAKGGYDDNGSFIGVYGDVINDEDAQYNLLNDDGIYIILVYNDDEDYTLWEFEEINNYELSNSSDNQSEEVLNTIEKYSID